MRLFIAVNLSDEIKDCLCACIARLWEHAVSGNFTRRENLHLTLAFIGETARLDTVKQAMEQVDSSAFPLQLGGFGRFSRPGGDICWVGVLPGDGLHDVYSSLREALRANGLPVESRPFTPHLTLGREVVLRKPFDSDTFARSIPPMRMPVGKISLMKSERIGGKLTYTEISAKSLRGD